MAQLAAIPEIQMIGSSAASVALQSEFARAAGSDAKVLITGETGVGKEVAARLIHAQSRRSTAAMVTLNCAGLPDSLLESELFGHVKGSFTGAYRDKPGLLEMAPNGTVFLDEVGEMSPRMQAVLLRFLETGEIQRLGADRCHTRVNVRLITATNRDLEREMAAGTFREDLFFRLNVFRIQIPPLRERVDDIEPLVRHFLSVYSRAHRMPASALEPAALEALLAYRWPGNIRELKNVMERAVLRAPDQLVRLADLPPEVLSAPVVPAAPPAERPEGAPAAPSPLANDLASAMLSRGESFWTAVYPLFMSHDLTRHDLRTIVRLGLERSRGSYQSLVKAFNMPAGDYKRFLSFLRKHDCHLPFHRFRMVSVPPAAARAPWQEPADRALDSARSAS